MDEALARRFDLGDPRPDRRLHRGVRDRQRRRGRQRRDKPRVVENGRVVCDEPRLPAGDDHRRDGPTGRCRWQRDRLTELIDERIGWVVDGVRDHEGPVS
jgi:hypothetical protein